MNSRSRVRKVKQNAALNITSMMDMFTIILVFLLRSFSADGSILTNADNLVLPNSQSHKKPQEVNLQVAVSNEMILVDNQPVMSTGQVGGGAREEHDPVIGKLAEKLAACLELEKQMVLTGALNRLERKVVIQADKNVSFEILYKVMNTCGEAGYENMNFAVMEREG
ncbi:MAG: ExbD/TolR family protein [Chitinispirillaceae bacterium]